MCLFLMFLLIIEHNEGEGELENAVHPMNYELDTTFF